MKIPILYEDSYLLIINKPNNVLVHKSYYARNIKDATLLDILCQQLGNNFYPVHRLDRKTSGVLVLAKSKDFVSTFQNLFATENIQKKYLGIVRGFLKNDLTITTPVKNPDTQVYKDAETHCKLLKTIALDIPVHPYKSSRYSLIKLTPKTGRMHQLRIHMNKVSHPLIGDHKYGDRFHNRMFVSEFNYTNLFLHAHIISFTHPFLSKKVEIIAPLPTYWTQLFKIFKWNLINS